MKSLHDYKGEYRAARKRMRRGTAHGNHFMKMYRSAQRLVRAYFRQQIEIPDAAQLFMCADVLAAGGGLEMVR